MVKLTGGGYDSRQHMKTTRGKSEPVSHKGNVAGIADQGMSVAYKKEEIRGGPNTGYQPYGPKDHTKQGPGAMRTIHRAGSQQPTPRAEPMKPGRDTLSEYGRDSITARGKR
jgi:hypothetical protein